MLKQSRDGWTAMAQADPEDGAVASWVRIAELAYGQGLLAAGQVEQAIAQLSASLAGRREWLADRPANAERQRALIIGLQALADALGLASRQPEACAMLKEAGAMVQRMGKAGSFTQLDRDSMVPLLGEGLKRHCPPTG